MAQSKSFAGAFDQAQIDVLLKALERAWDVISHTDDKPDHDALEALALCIITEARTGERNFVKLVNRSIMRFREMRTHKIVRKRKAAQTPRHPAFGLDRQWRFMVANSNALRT